MFSEVFQEEHWAEPKGRGHKRRLSGGLCGSKGYPKIMQDSRPQYYLDKKKIAK